LADADSGVAIPEAEWHNDFTENADGSVGDRKTPNFVSTAIMAGDYKHDYSQIRVPVLAFVAYPHLPQDDIRKHDLTNLSDRTIVEAVYGTYGHDKDPDQEN